MLNSKYGILLYSMIQPHSDSQYPTSIVYCTLPNKWPCSFINFSIKFIKSLEFECKFSKNLTIQSKKFTFSSSLSPKIFVYPLHKSALSLRFRIIPTNRNLRFWWKSTTSGHTANKRAGTIIFFWIFSKK